ncbi:MAG: hypothetical protein IPL39_23655 [Opitutaceae bacterium]|nr:hypothetical protein [Opitutaceae bacterium]
MPRYSPLPWKKTFRKLPPLIEGGLAKLAPGALCAVGCTKLITEAELAAGAYRHLCLETVADLATELRVLLPSPNVGAVSHANAVPEEQARKDLPKYAKLMHGRAPSWNGERLHRTRFHREVWQRELLPPALSLLGFRRLPDHGTEAGFAVHFQVQEALDPSHPEFRDTLLRCVNLLQENVGAVGVHSLNHAEADAWRGLSEDFGWSPLDEAATEAVLARIAQRSAGRGGGEFRLMRERFDCIRKLEPRRILHSTRGFVGYFLIDYCDNLAVFENLEVDNALYVIRADANALGRMSRKELFARVGEDVERIVHTKDWMQQLDNIVRLARDDQSPREGEMI